MPIAPDALLSLRGQFSGAAYASLKRIPTYIPLQSNYSPLGTKEKTENWKLTESVPGRFCDTIQ